MSACAPRMLCLALFASMALACASGNAPLLVSERRAAAAPPDWYLAPPADSSGALYGVGSATSLPNAKSAALVDLASKLAISVRATHLDRTSLRNGQLDQQIESEIVTRVRDREFQSYEVLESALANGRFYALVRIDRPQLILDTLERLRESNHELSSRLDPPATRSAFGYHLAFGEAQPALASAESSITLLATLSREFDPAPYLAQVRLYRERHESALAGIAVGLVPGPESAPVVGLVQELLGQAGMQSVLVGASTEAADACHSLCIEIASEWSGRYAVRRHIVFLTTTFRATSAEGVVTSARQHQVRGSALSSEDNARSAALQELRTVLQREGILRAVGFDRGTPSGLAQSNVAR